MKIIGATFLMFALLAAVAAIALVQLIIQLLPILVVAAIGVLGVHLWKRQRSVAPAARAPRYRALPPATAAGQPCPQHNRVPPQASWTQPATPVGWAWVPVWLPGPGAPQPPMRARVIDAEVIEEDGGD
jgi:hypothetical protein